MTQAFCQHGADDDHDLRRRVMGFLGGRYLPSLKRLEVTAERGKVTLRGRVSSFYEKQVAISSCQRVAGVRELVDRVDVCAGALQTAGGQSLPAGFGWAG